MLARLPPPLCDSLLFALPAAFCRCLVLLLPLLPLWPRLVAALLLSLKYFRFCSDFACAYGTLACSRIAFHFISFPPATFFSVYSISIFILAAMNYASSAVLFVNWLTIRAYFIVSREGSHTHTHSHVCTCTVVHIHVYIKKVSNNEPHKPYIHTPYAASLGAEERENGPKVGRLFL